MHENSCPVGPNPLHPGVPQGIAGHRGENGHVEHGSQGSGRKRHAGTLGQFQKIQRRQKDHPGQRRRGDQGHRVQRGEAAAKQHGVKRPHRQGGHDPQIAGIEPEFHQQRRTSLGHDDHDAGQGNHDSAQLAPAHPIPVQRPGEGDDDDRHRGVEQGGVGGRGGRQALVQKGLVKAHTQQPQQNHGLPFPPQCAPIGDQAAGGEGEHYRQRRAPTPKIERDGAHLVAHATRDEGVSGPKKEGKNQEQIGPARRGGGG